MARRRIEQAKLATGRIREDPAMQLVICVTRVRRCIGHSVVYFALEKLPRANSFSAVPRGLRIKHRQKSKSLWSRRNTHFCFSDRHYWGDFPKPLKTLAIGSRRMVMLHSKAR